MVKNFIPNCDLCGEEIPVGRHMRRNVSVDGMEVMMVALEHLDADLEFIQNDDGTVALDTCQECYTRMPLACSQSIN